jgi:hypothetical protein
MQRMRSWRADDLWRDFLKFCGARTPDDLLAQQFAQVVTAEMDESVRSLRAASVLVVLRTRLAGPLRRAM